MKLSMSDERSSRSKDPLEVKILIHFLNFRISDFRHTFMHRTEAELRNSCDENNTLRYKIVKEKNRQKSKKISEKSR